MTQFESDKLSRLIFDYIGTEAAEAKAWENVKEAEGVREKLTFKLKELGHEMASLVTGEPERTARVLVGEEIITISYDSSYPSNPAKISRARLTLKL